MSSDQELLALAASHEAAGRLAEAEAIYRQLLLKYPRSADLLHAIGLVAQRTGRAEEARQWLQRAIAIDPSQAVYFNNLGLILHASDEPDAAVACYEQALRLNPELAIVHYNLGRIRLQQGRWDDAIAHFRHALERIPSHADTHLNLGLALVRKGELAAGIAAYRAAVERVPDYAPLWNNLGNALKAQGDRDGAASAYRQALSCNPSDAHAANNLGDALIESGLVDEAIDCFRQSLAANPTLVEAHSNLIFAMQLQPDVTVAEIATECGRWWAQHGAPLHTAQPSFANDGSPDRRLRLGYVSPDLREHPLARHVLPLIRSHDAAQFEVLIYSDVHRPDAVTARFRDRAALWRDSTLWSDERLAEQIRRDAIDILVDLSLHSAGNRLRVFARQPAPVQVSFAGYPGSTGLETIRFRLTDRFLDPTDAAPSSHDEPIRLPDSFWCFDPIDNAPPIQTLPALDSGAVTFGCLSKFSKVNTRVIGWWSEILRRTPRSGLLLLCPAGGARERVAAAFQACGIDSERINFVDRLPRADYLALHHRLDLVLDPFPYNGHMTTCDALWMGAPVVSLAGRTQVSRGGLSLLTNVGLPELVAFTPEDYVQIAVELAHDFPRLAALRASLRERMRSSPLMDAGRFARSVESAFRSIWRRWCAENPSASAPEHAG